MNEIKIGSVVRLKSDSIANNKRYFTVVLVSDSKYGILGFNIIDGSLIELAIAKDCVDLIP